MGPNSLRLPAGNATEATMLWDERQLATYLHKSIRTVQSLRYLGTGPKFLKVGNGVLYRPTDVEAWLTGHERTSTSDAGGASLRGLK